MAAETVGESPALKDGLECIIGRAKVALPLEAVDQIIEYDVDPVPPLSRRWLSGFGTYAHRVVVSVQLVPGRPGQNNGRRTVKGVLLKTQGHDVGWVLEVASILARVRAQVKPRSPVQAGAEKLPAWMASATTDDRRTIGWIDVPAMLEELSGAAD